MGEGFPGRGSDSQPTILVSGRARELLRRVPLGVLDERARPDDGLVVVSASEDPVRVADRLTDGVAALDDERVALVDCSGTGEPDRPDARGWYWSVDSPMLFPRIAAALQAALAALHEAGVERVHVVWDALSTQFERADPDRISAHAHDVAATVGRESGLTICLLDRSAVDRRGFEELGHLVDVHVSVRRGESGPELRWTGLVDRSMGWVSPTDAGLRLDAPGTGSG